MNMNTMKEQATMCRMLADRLEEQVSRHINQSYENDCDATTTAIQRNIIVLRQELLRLSKLVL